MTEIKDITRKRGNTRRITVTVEDKDGPVDVSKWTRLKMVIASDKTPTDSRSMVETIAGNLLRGKKGSMYFTPSGETPAGEYFYEASCLDENRESFTFLEGKFIVTQDISK